MRVVIAVVAIALIAMISGSAFYVSYMQNPFVRNKPWISLDAVFAQEVEYGANAYDAVLLVTVHNPTHQEYSLGLERAVLSWSGENYTSFFFDRGNESLMKTLTVQGCLPAQMEFTLSSFGALTAGMKVRAQVEMFVTLNDMHTVLSTNSLEFTLYVIPRPTETSTTTQSRALGPNECLIPWV